VALAALALATTALVACTPPPSGGGSGTTTTAPTDLRHCPTRTAGQVRVAVVVDTSQLPGGAASPSVVCVVVASGSTGVAALGARAARLGTPAPRFNSSGLLCAIDGAPAAPACGVPSGGGFNYWSYWIGTTPPSGVATWMYSNVGPGSRAMADGAVEGWRFIAGGSNVAPNASPSFASLTN
jgi:hypothetical protein